jgi:hypothetical protein
MPSHPSVSAQVAIEVAHVEAEPHLPRRHDERRQQQPDRQQSDGRPAPWVERAAIGGDVAEAAMSGPVCRERPQWHDEDHRPGRARREGVPLLVTCGGFQYILLSLAGRTCATTPKARRRRRRSCSAPSRSPACSSAARWRSRSRASPSSWRRCFSDRLAVSPVEVVLLVEAGDRGLVAEG